MIAIIVVAVGYYYIKKPDSPIQIAETPVILESNYSDYIQNARIALIKLESAIKGQSVISFVPSVFAEDENEEV